MSDSRSTFAIFWKFRVKKGCEREFEKAYGPKGDWVRFFRKGKGYIKTELYQEDDGSYLTIDEWESQKAYEEFKHKFEREYLILDKEFESLTQEEVPIGSTTKIVP